MDRPKIKFKPVNGKPHVPPPSPSTVRRRKEAEVNPPPPKPEKPPKPPKPKREPSPLDIYKNSTTSEVQGIPAKARELVEVLVWEGKPRNAAAEIVGISDSYARRLLRSPDVIAHYLAELDVLRTSGRARLVHRLEALTEQDDNQTAAVAAAKVLAGMDAKPAGGGTTVNVGQMNVMPGWVIDCSEALAPRQPPRLSADGLNTIIDHAVSRNAPANGYQIDAARRGRRPPTGHGRPLAADLDDDE